MYSGSDLVHGFSHLGPGPGGTWLSFFFVVPGAGWSCATQHCRTHNSRRDGNGAISFIDNQPAFPNQSSFWGGRRSSPLGEKVAVLCRFIFHMAGLVRPKHCRTHNSRRDGDGARSFIDNQLAFPNPIGRGLLTGSPRLPSRSRFSPRAGAQGS